MNNAPDIGGGTKGAPDATMLYCVELTSISKYPFSPPPRVHGTAFVFALSCRNISCNLSKVGLPMIFVSTLYLKYNSLRLIFAVVLMLENSLGDTMLLIFGLLCFVALCFALRYIVSFRSLISSFNHQSMLLQRILDIIKLSLEKLTILQFTVWVDHWFWCWFIWLVVTHPCCVTSYLYSCNNVLISFW